MKRVLLTLCIFSIFTTLISNSVFALEKDTSPPVVVNTAPQSRSTSVPVKSEIVLTFNEAVAISKTGAAVALEDIQGNRIPCEMTIEKKMVRIRPQKKLRHLTSYTLTLPKAAVIDAAGNLLKESFSFSFVTAAPAAGENSAYAFAGLFQYTIILDAETQGPLTELQKAGMVEQLKALGIGVKSLQVTNKNPGSTSGSTSSGNTNSGAASASGASQNYNFSTFELELVAFSSSTSAMAQGVQRVSGMPLNEAATLVRNLPAVVYTSASLEDTEHVISELSSTLGAQFNLYGVNDSSRVKISSTTPSQSPAPYVDFILTSVGPNKLSVVKEIHGAFGVTLSEANQLANSVPVCLRSGMARHDAELVQSAFQSYGATVVLVDTVPQ